MRAFSFLKGGGGHSLRFLSVALVGLTVFLTIPSLVGAVDECDDPVNGAVTCSDPTYGNGIKYDETNGLTLTVQPSGTNTVTITPDIPPSRQTEESGGVFLEGGGTLKVILEGDVRIVNGADRTLQYFSDPPSRRVQAMVPASVKARRTDGVFVWHDQDKDGEIKIEIGERVMIGAPDRPVGHYGASAYFNQGDGDTTIVNRGKVYGHFRGIQVYYEDGVTGDVAVDTAKGSVTSMGIRVRSFDDITIQNHGRIEVKPMPRYRAGPGEPSTANGMANDAARYNPAVILVNHAGRGPDARSEIKVVSSGDLAVETTNLERYSVFDPPLTVDGVNLYTGYGTAGSHVPITLHLTGGTVTATGHGARLNHSVHSGGDIQVTLENGVRVGTEENPVGKEGIWSLIGDHSHTGDIRITNRAEIHAKGAGVYSWHYGSGDVVVRHEAGKIIAGDTLGELAKGAAISSDEKKVAMLPTGTAGIFAFHGGSEAIEIAGGGKNAEVGKIEIVSNADIESKGEGIYAYTLDLATDTPENPAFPPTIIPIMIDVTGGTITAKGAGVHAETATTYTDATQAGKITVTVSEKAAVKAEKDGVHVKGKRVFASDHARAGEHDQTVTIHGKVMGGGGEHAGVRMVKGGTLIIGPRAQLGAESGVAVKSDGKLTITMKKDDKDRIAWITGKFVNTADMTTFEGVSEDQTVVAVSDVKTRGVYEGGMERRVTLKKTTEDSLDTYQFKQESAREFREYHDRARVYEALPSVLLDLNRQTSAHARLSAARDGNGGWARVWFGDGEREADRSTTETGEKGIGLAWDFEHWGAEMGFDVPTSTEGVMLGVSAHYRDGEADVERGGRIDASGFGFGVSATYRAEEGLYVDGQVSYTRFDDIDLGSDARGRLASGLDADGYAVGLEVGRRMEMAEREVVLTPRGGLVWSSVDVDGFEDVKVEGYAGDRRVSFGSEDSFQGRIGVLAESVDGRIYASLDVEHEFSEDRDVTASGARLDSETEATWARLGLGFRVELDETGEAVLSGRGFYALADGDNRDYGASVALRARF